MDAFDLKIRWGACEHGLVLLLIGLNLAALANTFFNPVGMLLALPLLALDFVLFPISRGIARAILQLEPDLRIDQHGITLKGDSLPWHSIKSISLQTGRIFADREYFTGFKLLVFQRIFVLDKQGKEFQCIIDIDHSFKRDRKDNNYLKIISFLSKHGKQNLISDWAEKH